MQDLVKTHQGELLRLAWLLTGSAQETEALVRQVFLHAIRSNVEAIDRDALLGMLARGYLAQPDPTGDESDLTRKERLTLVYGLLAGVSLCELNRMVASTGTPLSTERPSICRHRAIRIRSLGTLHITYKRPRGSNA